MPTRFGVIQTAYANGASTEFLKNLGLEVVFTSTGVKYLHKKALEYDIGIYFEANGHGTVLFSDDFVSQLESLINEFSSKAAGELFMVCANFSFPFCFGCWGCFSMVILMFFPITLPLGSPQHQAALRLLATSQLINPAVGDALSGMLLVEAILQNKRWSFQTWCDLYTDLPSKQLKASCYFFKKKLVQYCSIFSLRQASYYQYVSIM